MSLYPSHYCSLVYSSIPVLAHHECNDTGGACSAFFVGFLRCHYITERQKDQGYRNLKRMAVNGILKRLCKEEEGGYVDLWDSFVGKEEMYLRDGLHLSGKGAAVFAEGLSGAVASGLGKVRYLN